ncbi:helix-turn-helix transcriptional regulator [Dactylosporangium aurantiacum]|uniref:Helix-turn-helix transcriptional regulator n=1 Tax=Dactylosporangium aurantiacum TaxID=35754 RepID=A0A9Q9ML20_9ACTN|nr:helix-turn-helix domain-containing protein [Dactylosporangium aurantiacum]MDG6102334.1 helix-turn-helix domain-containing protein [Dactylosporangium aurantiacum]UWZ53367.1 helix-turn-helix transcriptional regulator [Dactylosporangium aurantiacum]
MDELPIGRRVAYWRNRRKMSQQVFADRLGKSKSWVDKVERGVRRLDKFSVVYEIADVLQLDVQILLGKDPERRPDSVNCVDQVEVEEIRAALERYDQISAFFYAPPEPPPLPEMRKAVTHAWLSYQHAKYGMLARTLPRLLREAQAADTAYADGAQGREAAHLLGQVYQIASSALRKLGEHELAWLAADRSIAVSQRAGDQLLAGTATTRVALALLSLGRSRPALEINVNIANRLAPGTDGNDCAPERLSVYGMLLLQGAMAAARIGDGATVRDLLGGAEEAARGLDGDHNYYWSCFGPTNVQLHRAAAAVELGDGRVAVEVHAGLDLEAFNALLPERRAHHYLDQARAHALIGDIELASEMLLEGDRLAPSEIRCRPLAREVLSDVLRRTRGTPTAPVAELAEHMSVGV